MEKYFRNLKVQALKAYSIAEAARKKGLDPELVPEIALANDLAGRVEGLTGPKGISTRIRKLRKKLSKEEVALNLAKEIVEGKFGKFSSKKETLEQALRTSLAILTEGVVAAPLEGIVKVEIKKNYDNTNYLAIYFAGPIRSAGGSAQAVAVLTGDYIRRSLGIGRYQPTSDEIERFAEEVDLYNAESARLQYLPSSMEVRDAIKNIPIEITGEGTDKVEISGYRDLERIKTNRVRGGAILVLAEGVLQKAPKLLKYVDKFKIDGWDWLNNHTIQNKNQVQDTKIKKSYKFIKDIIAGRPIFCHPSEKGGFRLRYGRSRNSGLGSASIHPATMVILNDFLATGTQIKTERPGKGAAVTPCDSIEGPIVKLNDQSIVRVESFIQAEELKSEISEVTFLGDILFGYGEFLENNHPLMPSGYVEEWWIQDLEKLVDKGSKYSEILLGRVPNPSEAVKISEETGVPLHPLFTYFYENTSVKDLKVLAEWLSTGKHIDSILQIKISSEKQILEKLGVPHKVDCEMVLIHDYTPLLRVLGVDQIEQDEFRIAYEKSKNSMELVNSFGIKVMEKAPTFIGVRMGRPEKAKERKMRPPVNVLFPLGQHGGRTRDVVKAAEKEKISIEIVRRECEKCGTISINTLCDNCGKPTKLSRCCLDCRKKGEGDTCKYCGMRTGFYDFRQVDIGQILKSAISLVGNTRNNLKGVIGLTSDYKVPENLSKGILRSRNDVYVFRDGTVRFDATDDPLTHFIPSEIGVSIKKIKELGYETDIEGHQIENTDQVIELKCQDIIIPKSGAEYLFRSSKFIDEMLVKLYKLPPYYNIETKENLVGHLIIGLAPHTSAGILGRIIGFTSAYVCYAHPYFHAAKRRNCDGDEDAIFLLLDGFLNFSKSYLPITRGGKMDTPLVLTTKLDPMEVDEEVHNMDVCKRYPLDFYNATLKYINPQDIHIETIADRIGKNTQYNSLNFTHSTTDINSGPTISAYKTLGSMEEKVKEQLKIASKINAVNEIDVAKRVIESHFLPDIAGNLRAFSKQTFRCTKCNSKYRRIPLSGKCRKCNTNLVLTVHKGSVEKYLKLTKSLINNYNLDDYLKQRVRLLEMSIVSVFEKDNAKQVSLSNFLE
jgi:DNA polymerase II large subunit